MIERDRRARRRRIPRCPPGMRDGALRRPTSWRSSGGRMPARGRGELGALLRPEGLYSSHLITWRQQREAGLTPKKRGPEDRRPSIRSVKKLEQENRRLTSRLQQAEAVIAFQKKVSELLGIPLKPFVSDEDD